MTPTRRQLETALLPHLDAGFNLARWILGDDHDAGDAVQTACERAILYFGALRGNDARAWFLGIIRNVCFSALSGRHGRRFDVDLDEVLGGGSELDLIGAAHEQPDVVLERRATQASVNRVLSGLPPVFREVLILREIEQMSYDEIAVVIDAPAGTVMSRLSRARKQFRRDFAFLESAAEHG